MCLVMELCDRGGLGELLVEKQYFNEKVCLLNKLQGAFDWGQWTIPLKQEASLLRNFLP